MTEGLLRSIERKKRELDRHRPVSPSVLRKLEEEFSLAWTYNSNAIEGNTLTLQETEIVLKEGITIGGKNLNEHLEALNHEKSIHFLRRIVEKKEPLNLHVIQDLHRIILSSINDEEAGNLRRSNVRIMGARHIPPRAEKVPALMDQFLLWYDEHRFQLSIPEMAAELHYRFVMIHPFIDGNGRLARLLMNLFLMSNGYPPAIILKVDRKKYYRVLNQGNTGDIEPFHDFIGRSIERSLILYLDSIRENVSSHQTFMSLKEATRYCDYSQEYLSLLARTGRLEAIKIGRDWMTSREALHEYVSRVQSGRKEDQ